MVDMESILGEVEVWLLHARVTVRKGHNFYRIFQRPFSMESMWN